MTSGFGLYIHWPFCAAKCPYCDFNSHVTARIDESRWISAYEREIARVAELTGNRVLNTIFFGGGTPSLMSAESIARIISAARAAWTPANDLEITLEANPSSVEAARFAGYRDAGVTRVSIGVQSLRDPDLRRLGRLHDVAEARAAVTLAHSLYDRVSIDLIYARQDQTLEDWRAELTEAIDLGTDHLSLYQLTIEDGTAFGNLHRAGRLLGLPNEDLGADFYELTQELTVQAGLPAYEVSNHARPGQECAHNLIYWRAADYAGIGPGAHGRLQIKNVRTATETLLAPAKWLEAAESGNGWSATTPLDTEEVLAERLMMGIRTSEGVPLEHLSPDPAFRARVASLEDLGMVRTDEGRLTATAAGRPILNALIRELMA